MNPKRRSSDRSAVFRVVYVSIHAVVAFWDWLDKRQVFRRTAFLWVLWLLGEVARWTMMFAQSSPRPGLEVAAIIAAIWTPMGLLQGAVFKFYDEQQQGKTT